MEKKPIEYERWEYPAVRYLTVIFWIIFLSLILGTYQLYNFYLWLMN
jgi:hypothetical protein